MTAALDDILISPTCHISSASHATTSRRKSMALHIPTGLSSGQSVSFRHIIRMSVARFCWLQLLDKPRRPRLQCNCDVRLYIRLTLTHKRLELLVCMLLANPHMSRCISPYIEAFHTSIRREMLVPRPLHCILAPTILFMLYTNIYRAAQERPHTPQKRSGVAWMWERVMT